MSRYLIIGGGIAGLSAAEVLRAREPDASITLVGAEAHPPYSRPGLAYLLAGSLPEAQLTLRNPDELSRLKLDRRVGEVVGIDPEAHAVTLASGERLPYDRLLLAMGARALPLEVPGANLDGVVQLDHLEHARDILRRARRARSAVVVGGGPTAVELAEGLRAQGLVVHYLLRGDRYWGSVLDPTEAALVEAGLAREGILLRRNARVVAALGTDGVLAGVQTDAGDAIACELLAVAIGVSPRVELARAAGIAVGRGVLVDASLRTSAPDVFAAGDVAELRDPERGGTSMEGLWSSALAQGRAVGRAMAGVNVCYRPEPSLNITRLGGITIAIVGQVAPPESRMPDPDLRTFSRGDSELWRARGPGRAVRSGRKVGRIRVTLTSDRVVGALVMGDAASARALCHLVRARVEVPGLSEAGDPDGTIDALIQLGEASLARRGAHADLP